MNSARTVSSPVAGSRSTRSGRANRSSSNVARRATRSRMSDSNAASSGCTWTRSSIAPVSRSNDRDLRPRPSMWPVDEIEDERSGADADIAGTRTTLQPAHHATGFVPGARSGLFRMFQGVCARRPAAAAGGSDQNVTIDPNPVIERQSRARRRASGPSIGRSVTICAGEFRGRTRQPSPEVWAKVGLSAVARSDRDSPPSRFALWRAAFA